MLPKADKLGFGHHVSKEVLARMHQRVERLDVAQQIVERSIIAGGGIDIVTGADQAQRPATAAVLNETVDYVPTPADTVAPESPATATVLNNTVDYVPAPASTVVEQGTAAIQDQALSDNLAAMGYAAVAQPEAN